MLISNHGHVLSDRNKYVGKIMLFLLIAVYLIFCFTPLRLHYDSVRYFAIKDCIELGCPPDSDAARDFFPFGYTALLLILSKLGILSSFSIVFINCIYLFAGLWFISRVFKNLFSPILFFLIIPFSWLFIKFVTHPLSEMQYLFFSMGAIYFFYQYTRVKEIKFLLLSLLFSWLALETRTVGITLIAAIIVGIIWEFKEILLVFLKTKKYLVAGVIILITSLILIFSKQLGLYHYLGVLSNHMKEAPFFTRMGWRFTEWGEVFLNMPSGKLINQLPGIWGKILYILAGIIIFCWFCFALFSRKIQIPFFIKAYLVFYFIIMFNWPFSDPRFWVPVMPLMAAVVLQFPFNKNKALKILTSILLVVYILMGTISAGYMIYSSFHKKYFAINQANGAYQKEYEMHFFGVVKTDSTESLNSSDTTQLINPYILDLLKRHD